MSDSEQAPEEREEIAGFIGKTYEILDNEQFSKIVYWGSSGAEFIIKDTNKFEQLVLPRYFRHNKMNSFIRQLNMYGFHKSRKDNSKSIFSHPLFLRGQPHLLVSIKRKIKGKQAEVERNFQTPLKNGPELCSTKETPATGRDLHSGKLLMSIDNNSSFRQLIESRDAIFSRLNLNKSLNKLSHTQIPGWMQACQVEIEDDCVSLEDEMPIRSSERLMDPTNRFVNPSCFFGSMKHHH